MKNNLSYYPRYIDWHRHPKMKMLRVKFGEAGDSKFGTLCDLIGEAEFCWLDISKPYIRANVADALRYTHEELDAFLAYLDENNCDLIIRKDGKISTETAQQTLLEVMKERKSARDRKNNNKGKTEKDKSSPEPNNDSDNGRTTETTKESKGEDTKINQTKGEERESPAPDVLKIFPKEEKYIKYFVGPDPIHDLKIHMEANYCMMVNQLRDTHGEENYNNALSKFSMRNLQKQWKDYEDLRSHFSSYFAQFLEKLRNANKVQTVHSSKIKKDKEVPVSELDKENKRREADILNREMLCGEYEKFLQGGEPADPFNVLHGYLERHNKLNGVGSVSGVFAKIKDNGLTIEEYLKS